MLKPRLLRTLLVNPADHPRGQPHLSAASGLVVLQGRCYVVADDEHHLGKFKLQDNSLVKLKRLFDGELPLDPKKRKAAKPDLEVLALLPGMARYPHGALLALGSGSKPQRHTALVMALDAEGKLGKGDALVSQEIDLTPLYAPLHAEFADLNIEGCIVQGDELHLVQRGNKGRAGQSHGGPSHAGPGSAAISLHWPQVQAWLLDAEDTPPPPSRISPIELGDIDGIPLTPTDACLLPNGHWLLSAAAENTADSTLDGPCAGSALAVVSPEGKVQQLHYLHGAPKVEGISVQASGSTLTVLMVTDADHPDVPSQLLALVLP